MNEDRVAVARLIRSRGTRGEVLAVSLTSHPEKLSSLEEVRVEIDGNGRMLRVEEVWFHDGRPVFKFAGVDSIDDAEALRGGEVQVPRTPPPEGEYAFVDLIGCRVIEGGAAGAGEVEIGVVEGVEEFGGPALLRVKSIAGRELLIPFARAICREIDVTNRWIRVELPEGLAELG